MKKSIKNIPGRIAILVAMSGAVAAATAMASAAPLEIVAAGYLGGSGEDDLQSGCVAPDGTIYLAGNLGELLAAMPGGVRPTMLGTPADEVRCGSGLVVRLSADGRRILAAAQLAPGIAIFTTVQVNEQGVYVGGYASEALQPLLAEVPGLIREYPLAEEVALIREGKMLAANAISGDRDPIEGRPGLGRYGAPCLLRFSPDLKQITAGTYLEGWQQVWDKNRVARLGQVNKGPFLEYFWQPTSIALLGGGDVVVSHDGGYFRLLTAADQPLIAQHPSLAHRISFYDVCDWVSRLSPDLERRAWRQAIYTPQTDPEVARRVKDGWPYPHYSNPRTHRMRIDAAETVVLCGWSASATSSEPWWSPYLWVLDPRSGRPRWKAYHYDPMSGGGNRMDGTVADTAVLTVAPDGKGNWLTSLIADGGNTVMGWGPRGAEGRRMLEPIRGGGFGVKLVHFWGQIHRVSGKSRDGLGGARIGPWGWVVDLAPLSGRRVLALGRYNDAFEFTADAWRSDSPLENPNAFLRVYSPEFDLEFSTALPGVVPFEVAPLGGDRLLIVGHARPDVAITRNPLQPQAAGRQDGYYLIVRSRPATGE